jgi:hypothetical protein
MSLSKPSRTLAARAVLRAALALLPAGGLVVRAPIALAEGALSLALDVEPSAETIDAEALRATLEEDLGVPVVLQRAAEQPTIAIRADGGDRVVVVFRRQGRRDVERTIDVPADRGLAAETIAFAASNLARDEASEILARLDKRRSVATAKPPPPEPPPSDAPAPVVNPCGRRGYLPIGADLVPYVGTSSWYGDRARLVSFNLLAGTTRGVHALEIGGGANIDSEYMCGVQIAGAGNVVLGPVRGIQLAPVDIAMGSVVGAQISVVGIVDTTVDGVQLGTVVVAGDAFRGVQLSTVAITAGPLDGVQTGVVAVTYGDLTGLQLASVAIGGGNVSGAQIGTASFAGGAVRGLQLGVANVAIGPVKGTQIGVVNYADDGDAIGLVSVHRRGRTSLDTWGTEAGLVMAGVRHGGHYVHNLFGAGRDLGGSDAWALAVGLGVRLPLATRLHLDVDAIHYFLKPPSLDTQLSVIQATAGYAITPALGVFAGPTFNTLVSSEPPGATLGPAWSTTRLDSGGAESVHIWPGATVGVRATL